MSYILCPYCNKKLKLKHCYAVCKNHTIEVHFEFDSMFPPTNNYVVPNRIRFAFHEHRGIKYAAVNVVAINNQTDFQCYYLTNNKGKIGRINLEFNPNITPEIAISIINRIIDLKLFA